MAVNVNNPFQLDDPNAILGQQNAQITADLAGQGRGTPLSQYGTGLGALFSRFVYGDPAVMKAQNEQSAARAAQAGLAPQGESESDIDYAIRSAHAMYKAIAPIDSNKAGALMDHIVTLQQARTQQNLLTNQEQEQQQKSLIEQGTKGTFELMSPDGLKSYGSVNRFLDDGKPNPDFGAQLSALKQQYPDGIPVTAEQAFANRAMIANQRGQMQLLIASLKDQQKNETGLTPDGVKQAALQALGSMSFASRLTGPQKTAVENLLGSAGMNSLVDGARARAEMAGVQAAMTQAGRRTGNIAVLENSLWSEDNGRPGLGNLVETALQGVNRTRMPFINEGIARLNLSGILKNGGPEAAYAGSVQSFINEYARVMSGGGTMSTDTARREASDLLSRAQSPEMVHAAIQQLAQKETKALKDAGDFTLETLAGKAKYPTLTKISQRLGVPVHDIADAGSASDTAPEPQAPAGPPTFKSESDVPPGFKGKAIIGGRAATVS